MQRCIDKGEYVEGNEPPSPHQVRYLTAAPRIWVSLQKTAARQLHINTRRLSGGAREQTRKPWY